MKEINFANLWEGKKSSDISLIFSGWKNEKERIVIFSPHDDDALLGAAYLILAAQSQGAQVHIVIFCDGNAGYSQIRDKKDIVKIRKKESILAYKNLNIPEERITWLGYPDFSINPRIGWFLPDGSEGTFSKTIALLRKIGATRLILPNSYREHSDHQAVFSIGTFDGPQAGDKILADIGNPAVISSFIQYSVWGDFSSEETLAAGKHPSLKANYAVLVSEKIENLICKSILEFKSQGEIIESIINQRKERKIEDKFIELYLKFNPRQKLDYSSYKKIIGKIK